MATYKSDRAQDAIPARMVHAGVVVYQILKTSPAAKGVPIAAPFTVISQVAEALKDGIETVPADAKRENK